MSEQNPLTISQLIKVLKEVKKQAGDLPVMFYTGEENGVTLQSWKIETGKKAMFCVVLR